MLAMYSQGDVLLVEMREAPPHGKRVPPGSDGVVVLMDGGAAGHRHALIGPDVVFFRDEGVSLDAADLFLGHVHIGDGDAEWRHEKHGSIRIPRGTYRVRRRHKYGADSVRYILD